MNLPYDDTGLADWHGPAFYGGPALYDPDETISITPEGLRRLEDAVWAADSGPEPPHWPAVACMLGGAAALFAGASLAADLLFGVLSPAPLPAWTWLAWAGACALLVGGTLLAGRGLRLHGEWERWGQCPGDTADGDAGLCPDDTTDGDAPDNAEDDDDHH